MQRPEVLEQVQRIIVLVRGHRVILDADLARLYGVENRTLLQAVRRNVERFPVDFMFQLTVAEAENVEITQETVAPSRKSRRGQNTKYLPYAFTEQGVAMLSSVLRSPRAIEVNIEIMRAKVRGAVKRGRASSVSAFVAEALEARLRQDSLAGLVRELIAERGEPSRKHKTWARRVLGAKPR